MLYLFVSWSSSCFCYFCGLWLCLLADWFVILLCLVGRVGLGIPLSGCWFALVVLLSVPGWVAGLGFPAFCLFRICLLVMMRLEVWFCVVCVVRLVCVISGCRGELFCGYLICSFVGFVIVGLP